MVGSSLESTDELRDEMLERRIHSVVEMSTNTILSRTNKLEKSIEHLGTVTDQIRSLLINAKYGEIETDMN